MKTISPWNDGGGGVISSLPVPAPEFQNNEMPPPFGMPGCTESSEENSSEENHLMGWRWASTCKRQTGESASEWVSV